MTQENNTQAAIDAGKEIATATLQKLQDFGGIPYTVDPKGNVAVHVPLLVEQDKRASAAAARWHGPALETRRVSSITCTASRTLSRSSSRLGPT